MTENLKLWNALRTPPKDALKEIKGGRLAGKFDISPVWRMEALTEQFGPVGTGWKYTIEQLWLETTPTGEVAAFARVDLCVRIEAIPDGQGWSAPIPGVGGSMFIENQKHGPHINDDAYKMAVTDALSVAMKALGMAADVYRGMMDSKHQGALPQRQRQEAPPTPQAPAKTVPMMSEANLAKMPTKVGDSIPKKFTKPTAVDSARSMRKEGWQDILRELEATFGKSSIWDSEGKKATLKDAFGTYNLNDIAALSDTEWAIGVEKMPASVKKARAASALNQVIEEKKPADADIF